MPCSTGQTNGIRVLKAAGLDLKQPPIALLSKLFEEGKRERASRRTYADVSFDTDCQILFPDLIRHSRALRGYRVEQVREIPNAIFMISNPFQDGLFARIESQSVSQ